MRVDQARYDDRTLQVDDGSRWAANSTHLLEASDLDELAVSHAPRLSASLCVGMSMVCTAWALYHRLIAPRRLVDMSMVYMA